MPNRIIREGWLDSERVNQLDAKGESFFLRLCLRADDFGRFTANPQLLKSSLFPLRDDARNADMTRQLAACEKAGLLRCYSVENKRYLEIVDFRQQRRAVASKFPDPPDGVQTTSERVARAQHKRSTCVADAQHMHTKAESYSESNAKAESESGAPAGAGTPSVEIPPVSLETLMANSAQLGIPPETARLWWLDMDGAGWLDAKSRPIRNWQSALKGWHTRFQSNEAKNGRRGAQKTGIAHKDY